MKLSNGQKLIVVSLALILLTVLVAVAIYYMNRYYSSDNMTVSKHLVDHI